MKKRYRPTYFVVQAFKGMKRHSIMTFASIAVLLSCLVVMGCFSMLLINIERNLSSLGDLNQIVAFVYSDVQYKEGDIRPTPVVEDTEDNSFLGWSTDPNASEPEIPVGQNYQFDSFDAVSGKVTLYAVWQNKAVFDEFKVKYHTMGVEVTNEALEGEDKAYKIGDEIPVPEALSPRNPTLKFLGWSLSPSSDAEVLKGDTYVLSKDDVKAGNIYFYAMWSKNVVFGEYSVEYDLNGYASNMEYSDSALILSAVKKSLEDLNGVSDIDFISKSDALEEEIEKYADYPGLQEFLKEGNNPLPDTFIVKYSNDAEITALELKMQNIDGVSRVKCRSDIASSIENLKNGIILVFTWFMIILFVVSIFVIINTVKLAVSHRSEEISVMRYIGATKWFIALPFELEGVFIGLFSGILSFLLQWYAYGYIQDIITDEMKMIEVVPFTEIGSVLLAGCVLVGIITGFIGSLISIRKKLNN